jgi:signal transduction histidine kinase
LNDLVLQGDGDRLTEALLNLIENAVRYNKENGVVDISYVPKNGAVHITVSDTGIGIAAEDRNRIFDRFYRSDAVRNSDGTGLGLNIVKLIVEGHHGTIMVDSILGEGSCFSIILPLSASCYAS